MAIFILLATSQLERQPCVARLRPEHQTSICDQFTDTCPGPRCLPVESLSPSALNEEIQKLKGPKTQVIDLGGHFVMPGFNDAHVHLGSGGFEKLNVDLVGSKSLDDMKQRIAARVKTAAPGEWIHWPWLGPYVVGRTKNADTRGHRLCHGNHPAIFNRVDGHIAIANSAALKAAGVTAQSPDPHGGKIDRDDKGEPTGILRETAMGLVGAKIPPPSLSTTP